jgi:uncharacterized membrane protein
MVSLALILGLAVIAQADAAIAVKLKNSSSETISVAVNYMNLKGQWVTMGWYEVKPGKAITTDIKTDNSYVYFYGEGDDGGVWDGDDEKDSIERWIVDEAFTIYDKSGGKPKGSGLKEVSFFERRAEGNVITQNFTD